ncbi:flagellar hook protein FlgE [Devosia naphthalenivorans]|uniref:flagellar hook protein FlgE n=1 Tax=Devosia naphthalenivorans TaxID=2082392 RepID=UPI000D3652CE|nr:flagellar hook-basal body complex protein [Devosia naphthalenivorans]
MGIYGALSAAVTGLRAQSHALENISGNIANSQTTGYKRIETDFLDLIPDAPLKRQVPGAVIAQSRGTNDVKGDIRTVSNETFVALNSNGFFVVEPKIGQSDGNSVFAGTNFYTRRGDFEIDKDGRLVNGAGYYLKGLDIDPGTGNISGSVPKVIELSNAFLPAQKTNTINYQANLPQLPKTANYKAEDDESELLKVGDFTGGIDTIKGGDGDEFVSKSISGGAITIYATNGAPANVQMRWAKTASADADAGTKDTWNLFYMTDSDADVAEDMWIKVDQDFTFGANGALEAPTSGITSLTEDGPLSINGIIVDEVVLNHGTKGISQFADVNGTANVSTLSQNGYGAGEFVSVAINDSGRVVATYSNGERIDMAQLVTADFNAINGLKRLDGGVFSSTSESGEPILDFSGTGVIGGALEASNTDISDEFTKLIVTQQAYSAGTRIVSTADEMLQEALNMIR